MGQIALSIPQVGQSDQTEDPKVANDLTILQTWANGNVDSTNLSAAAAQSACVNQAGQTVKSAVNITPTQSTTSTTYTTLSTPDQVTGIVLPTNGLIAVWYQAIWEESVSGAARAAIFLGSNQLQAQSNRSPNGPQVIAAATGGGSTANINLPLVSCLAGLGSASSTSSFSTDVGTGQAVGLANTQLWHESNNSGVFDSTSFGGPCYVFASAGTYTVSVQFKASSGTVFAAGRKLWVQAVSFI